MESRTTSSLLRIWTLLVVLFLYVPLAIIVLYAFNRSNVQTWPIGDYSTHWFSVAWNDQEVRDAFVLSLKVACAATAVALVLGTAAAFAVARYRFFGVNSVSFLVVIPIALPGVITGIALQSSFSVAGIPFSLWTIMIGHATFCIVIVFNNVIARLRRMSPSIEDASMDLGANGLQTFRYILLPELRSALVAGALLAFALSWDEVIVTIFTAGGNTTIPIWIWTGLRTGGSGPEINVVAAVVVLLSIVPVYLAQRLTSGADSRSAAEEPVVLAAATTGLAPGLMAVRALRWTFFAVALACTASACGTSGSPADQPLVGPSAPEAQLPRAEGALRLLVRQGYAEGSWVGRFERSTGCRVEVRYADTADGLRRAADGWAFDVASIPGGLAYAVVEDGGARALNPGLVPQRASFRAAFRDPAAARAGARRYGVAFMWSPRLLLWRQSIRKHAPATWGPLSWNTKARRGRVALEDTALGIGDAALSLRKLAPGLAIGDPYALDENQFAAALALTKRRLQLAGALWQLPGDEIDAFDGGLVDVGAGDWYTVRQIRDRNVDVGLTLPREGAAGEVDVWMLGARAPHPGCAYRWMRYASGARVQAQVARYFGATPVNADACALLGRATCHALHADAPRALLNRIAFRHTPVESCGGGRRCVPFARWEQAWSDLRGG